MNQLNVITNVFNGEGGTFFSDHRRKKTPIGRNESLMDFRIRTHDKYNHIYSNLGIHSNLVERAIDTAVREVDKVHPDVHVGLGANFNSGRLLSIRVAGSEGDENINKGAAVKTVNKVMRNLRKAFQVSISVEAGKKQKVFFPVEGVKTSEFRSDSKFFRQDHW